MKILAWSRPRLSYKVFCATRDPWRLEALTGPEILSNLAKLKYTDINFLKKSSWGRVWLGCRVNGQFLAPITQSCWKILIDVSVTSHAKEIWEKSQKKSLQVLNFWTATVLCFRTILMHQNYACKFQVSCNIMLEACFQFGVSCRQTSTD